MAGKAGTHQVVTGQVRVSTGKNGTGQVVTHQVGNGQVITGEVRTGQAECNEYLFLDQIQIQIYSECSFEHK